MYEPRCDRDRALSGMSGQAAATLRVMNPRANRPMAFGIIGFGLALLFAALDVPLEANLSSAVIALGVVGAVLFTVGVLTRR